MEVNHLYHVTIEHENEPIVVEITAKSVKNARFHTLKMFGQKPTKVRKVKTGLTNKGTNQETIEHGS